MTETKALRRGGALQRPDATTTTTTTTSKRLRGWHDAAAEPSSGTTTNTTTTTVTTTSKRLRGSHAAESGGKKRKMEAPDASSSRDASPGKQDAGKETPEVSSGPAKMRKASRPKQRLRCCRRCLQLTEEERRAWQNLKAAGVPLLTRCEVRTMCRGEGSLIGMGGSGACVKVLDPRTELDVVLKSLYREGPGDLEQEAAALWALRRVPGLQRLVGACVQTNQLVTLFAGESLYEYFGTDTRRPAATAQSVFQQTTHTLQAMGEAGYAHNDVKPCNVCAREQEGRGAPEVTVIDVGVALPVGSSSGYTQIPDPDWFSWVAPELLLHTGPCGEASDAYGLAYLMDEVLDMAKNSPSLAPVHAWLERARSRDPHARPGLAELQEVLQTALAEEGKQ